MGQVAKAAGDALGWQLHCHPAWTPEVWGLLERRAAAAGPASGDKPAAGKDPVADAFELPGPVRLRADQVKDLQRLREQYEPQLRAALQKVEGLPKSTEKDTAARKVFKLRREIRAGIEAILTKPDPNPPKPKAKPKKNNKNKNRNKKQDKKKRKR